MCEQFNKLPPPKICFISLHKEIILYVECIRSLARIPYVNLRNYNVLPHHLLNMITLLNTRTVVIAPNKYISYFKLC